MPDTPNFCDSASFEAKVRSSPLQALQQCQADYMANDAGHRETRWKLIERAILISYKMQKSPKDREALKGDNFWKDRTYKLKLDEPLPYMQYLVGAASPKSRRYNTACDYAGAASLLTEEGIKPDQIFAELKKRGGPYNVLKKGKKGLKKIDLNEHHAETEESESGDKDDGSGRAPKNSLANPTSSASSTSEEQKSLLQDEQSSSDSQVAKRVRIFDANKHIAITGNTFQHRMLAINQQEMRWVLLKWVDDEGGTRRIEVIDVKKEHEMRIRSH